MTCFTPCFRRKNYSQTKETVDINEEISNVGNAKLYTYKELQIATENFSRANKIGEGGFGSVYKGKLKNGTLAAIKVLSAESKQGVQEFLNEIRVISRVEHENIVKLYGCCTEGDQRILVYGYLENKSLAQTLLGGRHSHLLFSWKTRSKICIGVAQGLAFLHDEVQPHFVHRDIKASNILLDKDFIPKISDFGLAKLLPEDLTHVSTRVAGTLGYLAPEYAIHGKLTRKADTYSFGVLLLEIVCGRFNINRRLPADDRSLIETVWRLYEKNELAQLVDIALEEDFNAEEACRYMKIGLLCTQDMPKNRPTMSAVVKMLKGEIDTDETKIYKPRLLKELIAQKSSSKAPDASTPDCGTLDKSSWSQNTNMTCATITLTSISDRSN